MQNTAYEMRISDWSSDVCSSDLVDFLALHFLHHSLDAAALHADACADRIDRRIVADDADLGAAARIACSGLDLDNAVVDFGHFLREQLLHEIGMRAAEEDLRPPILAHHLEDQAAEDRKSTRLNSSH